MTDRHRTYTFDQIHNRFWEISPAAWVIAKSSAPAADLEDIQTLPDDDGATISVKFKTAVRGEVTIRGKVSPNGNLTVSHPENMEDFGSIFDKGADKRLAAVIAQAIGKR